MRAVLRRILAVVKKELLHLRRDRLSAGMVFGVPVMQLILFGYAINQDVRGLDGGVCDQAQTHASRALVEDARATQIVDLVTSVDTPGELEDLMRTGAIDVGLVIPPDFERRRVRGEAPYAQLLVDGSDPIVMGAARGLRALPLLGADAAVPANERPSTFAVRAYYNPEGRSAVQIVPGLIGVILTMTMTLFTAVSIVRERERGNLELLITTPIRTPELLLAKITPYVVIGLLQTTLVLLVGGVLFDVHGVGRVPHLYAASLVFVAATLSLGLLISTLAKTQFQAFQLTFFTFLPQMLLSGFMFPFDGMPRPAQVLAEALPLTHFLRIVRGIMLRGATLVEMAHELVPLGIFFGVTMTLAALRFRKTLD